MRRVIVDAILPCDHAGYAGGRPYGTPKAEGLRPPLQQVGQMGKLLGRQLGLGTRSGVAAQCLDPLGSGPREPLADRSRCDTQRSGDSALLPALLVEFPRPEPTTFFPVVGLDWFCLSHTTRCSTSRTIITYPCTGQ